MRTACAAFWCRRCSGGRGAAKVSSRNVTPTPSVPPTSRKVAGVQGFPLTISANSASRTEMTLPSWASPATAWSRNASCSLRELGRPLGQDPVGPAERREHLAGVPQVEEVDHGEFSLLDQADLQVPHEPGRRHPEVVADHHDRLDVLAVALPQRGDQLRVLLAPPGEEPLLELVEDQQHLLAGRERPAPPQRGQRIDQVQSGGQVGTGLAQAPQQPGLGLLRRRLDVDRQHVLAPAGAAAPP